MMTFNCCTVFITFVLLTAGIKSNCHAWNYDGSGGDLSIQNWQYNYSMCAGIRQSPIDINTTTTSNIMAVLSFGGYNTSSTSRNYTIINTGRTVQINVNTKTISLTNSRLNGTYVLEQFHFHWGAFDNNGSEHSIDGQFHSSEMHMVHYNSDKYNNVSHAASFNDSSALLVLGIFIDVASSDTDPSTTLDTLVNHIVEIPYKNNKTDIPSFPVESLFPCRSSEMYTYSGSLTAPPCVQVVNWNVFARPIYMSRSNISQLELFRHVHGDTPTSELTFTDRPIQLLNNRTVYEYTIPSPCSLAPPIVSTAAAGTSTSSSFTTMSSDAESLHSIKILAALLKLAVITCSILSAVLF